MKPIIEWQIVRIDNDELRTEIVLNTFSNQELAEFYFACEANRFKHLEHRLYKRTVDQELIQAIGIRE
jgi:hypothetical protein